MCFAKQLLARFLENLSDSPNPRTEARSSGEKKKTKHNLKTENSVLFGILSEDFKPRIALRGCS